MTTALESNLYRRDASTNSPFTYHNHVLVGSGLYFVVKQQQLRSQSKGNKLSRVRKFVNSASGGSDFRLTLVQGQRKGRLCGIKLFQHSEITVGKHTPKAPTPYIINVSGIDKEGRVVHWSLAASNELDRDNWLSALVKSRDSIADVETSAETERLRELGRRMKGGLKLHTRLQGFKLYRNCFSGAQATGWISKERNCSRTDAALVAMSMFHLNIFEHISHEHLFLDGKLLYCFTDQSKNDRDNYLAPFRALSKLHRMASQELHNSKLSNGMLQLQIDELVKQKHTADSTTDMLMRRKRTMDIVFMVCQALVLMITAYYHFMPADTTPATGTTMTTDTTTRYKSKNNNHHYNQQQQYPNQSSVALFAIMMVVGTAVVLRMGVGSYVGDDIAASIRQKQEEERAGVAGLSVDVNRRLSSISGTHRDDSEDEDSEDNEEDEDEDEDEFDGYSGSIKVGVQGNIHDTDGESSSLDDPESDGSDEEDNEEEYDWGESDAEEDEYEEEEEDEDYIEDDNSSTTSTSTATLSRDRAITPTNSESTPGGNSSPSSPDKKAVNTPRSKPALNAMRASLEDISNLPHPSSWPSPLLVRRSPDMIKKSDYAKLSQAELLAMIAPVTYHGRPVQQHSVSRAAVAGTSSPAAAASLAELQESAVLSENSQIPIDSDFFKGFCHLIVADLPDSPRTYFRSKKRRYLCVFQGKFTKHLPFSCAYTGQALSTSIEALPSPTLIHSSLKLLGSIQPALSVNLKGEKPFVLTPLVAAAQAIVITPPDKAPPDVQRCLQADISDDMTVLGPKFKNMTGKKRMRYFGRKQRLDKKKEYAFDTEHTYTFTFYSNLIDFTTFRARLGVFNYDLTKVLGTRPIQLSVVAWDPVEAREKKGKRARPRNWPFVWNIELWNQRGIPQDTLRYLKQD